MANFLVLGFIPGTNVQISFMVWIALTFALTLVLLGRYEHRKHALRFLLVSLSLLLATRLSQRA